MSVKYEFYMSEEDTERLFAIKNNLQDKNDLTGNEFAKELLHDAIRKLHPQPVPEDEED